MLPRGALALAHRRAVGHLSPLLYWSVRHQFTGKLGLQATELHCLMERIDPVYTRRDIDLVKPLVWQMGEEAHSRVSRTSSLRRKKMTT